MILNTYLFILLSISIVIHCYINKNNIIKKVIKNITLIYGIVIKDIMNYKVKTK